MATVETLREIRMEDVWLELSDGCRLSARVWLPVDAEESPVPAILEYLPYRKGDATALRDLRRHPYFARHGYAAVRVDMRGTGDSTGILEDEYLELEQDDALEILSWLAAQPWCTGAAGIIGISWGGFNGLQIAARRPPELKAVISLCATDDRYADDVHYRGGCLHEDMLAWASSMLAFNARPPDPRIVGDGWRELWLDRLERTPPYVEAWLAHQRRDDYWRHGSICEDWSAIECPVYIQSGWADIYRNPVASILERLQVPRKGLIGPWAHVYPDMGGPGAPIDFHAECVRWWDQWLKGIETGVMDEPMLTAFIPEPVEASPAARRNWLRAGRWVSEPSWPSPNVRTRELVVAAGGLTGSAPAVEEPVEVASLQLAGLEMLAGGLVDQRADDARWSNFDTEPLDEELTILGRPLARLALAADRPAALVAVRLSDVGPAGTSTRVTQGFLNLTHRDSHAEPESLVPGERYDVRVQLDFIAHVFRPGHRLRLSVSPTCWPSVWPSPEPVTLTLFAGAASVLELPVRTGPPDEVAPRPFDPAPPFDDLGAHFLPRRAEESVEHDLRTGETTFRTTRLDRDGVQFADGYLFRPSARDEYSIAEGDPLSARVRCERGFVIEQGDWRTHVETDSTMTADAQAFHVTNVVEAYVGGARVFAKTWRFAVARDLV